MDRLRDLPDEARPFFERLLAFDLLPNTVLAAQVARHLGEFEEECAARGGVETARRLSEWSYRLLGRWDQGISVEDKRLIQAAVLYFVMEGDAADDTQPGGLEDDEAVLRSVMAVFGLEE